MYYHLHRGCREALAVPAGAASSVHDCLYHHMWEKTVADTSPRAMVSDPG